MVCNFQGTNFCGKVRTKCRDGPRTKCNANDVLYRRKLHYRILYGINFTHVVNIAIDSIQSLTKGKKHSGNKILHP